MREFNDFFSIDLIYLYRQRSVCSPVERRREGMAEGAPESGGIYFIESAAYIGKSGEFFTPRARDFAGVKMPLT